MEANWKNPSVHFAAPTSYSVGCVCFRHPLPERAIFPSSHFKKGTPTKDTPVSSGVSFEGFHHPKPRRERLYLKVDATFASPVAFQSLPPKNGASRASLKRQINMKGPQQ